MTAGPDPLRFEILGPVRAWRGETEVPLGPARQRSLLALLLAHSGGPASMDTLVRGLWGDRPPAAAVNVVHRLVGVLRRIFEPALPARTSGSWLLLDGNGYRMAVDESSLDLLRFRRLVAAAGDSGGSVVERADLLFEALELSHGPVAAGLDASVRTGPLFTAIDHEVLVALRAAADAALSAGRPQPVLAAMRAAAHEHPLDETLHAGLMQLLSADGQSADAVEVFHDLRRRLADQLGVEPGAVAGRALDAILGPGRETAPPEVPAVPRPAQLPARVAAFAGREDETAEMIALASATPPVLISTVVGMPGVGKTTFAVHCAHLLAERFRDGQLYLNLRGFSSTSSMVSPAQALKQMLDTFAVPPNHIPADLDGQAALFRSLVADRRMLILLDNARDAEHVRLLLPGSTSCFTIVTSRVDLTDLVALQGAHALTLAPLPDDTSRQMLSRRLGATRVNADPTATDEIVRVCAGLPLALAIVAARAAIRPAFPISSVAHELTAERSGLPTLAGIGAGGDMAALFSWSYQALSPGAARLFRLLGIFPGPSADPAAAARLADVDDADVHAPLGELTRAHLIDEIQPGRFAFHDLVRSYAAELATATDSDADRRAALYRLFAWYYQGRTVEAVHLVARGDHPATGTGRHYFAGRPAAAEWLTAERVAILAAVTIGHAEGFDELAIRLADTIDVFLDMSGWRDDRVAVQRVAVEAAAAVGNSRVMADSTRNLGFAESAVGHPDLALRHLNESLRLSRAAGDVRGEARTYRAIANVMSSMGQVSESLRYVENALEILRDLGGTGLGNALNELGYTHAQLGDFARARRLCLEALDAIVVDAMPERTRSAILDSLGYIEHHDGNLDLAAGCYREAVELRGRLGERYPQATSLLGLGEVMADAGDAAGADAARIEALSILERIGHPDAESVRTRFKTLLND